MYINSITPISKECTWNKYVFLKPDGNLNLTPQFVRNYFTLNPITYTSDWTKSKTIQVHVGSTSTNYNYYTLKSTVTSPVYIDLPITVTSLYFWFEDTVKGGFSANLNGLCSTLYGKGTNTVTQFTGSDKYGLYFRADFQYSVLWNFDFTISPNTKSTKSIESLSQDNSEPLKIDGFTSSSFPEVEIGKIGIQASTL